MNDPSKFWKNDLSLNYSCQFLPVLHELAKQLCIIMLFIFFFLKSNVIFYTDSRDKIMLILKKLEIKNKGGQVQGRSILTYKVENQKHFAWHMSKLFSSLCRHFHDNVMTRWLDDGVVFHASLSIVGYHTFIDHDLIFSFSVFVVLDCCLRFKGIELLSSNF